MLIIDGSKEEGGGQLIRTALALSTITRQPFSCINIRKGRKQPGLKAQHVAIIDTLCKWTGAKVVGNTLGSSSLEFFPGKTIPATHLNIEIGTAGSIVLVLQTLLLPALFAEGRVKFSCTGGSDVSMSPVFDYFQSIFLPHIKKFCKKLSTTLLQRGFEPQGEGKIELLVEPQFSSATPEFLTTLREQVPPINLIHQQPLLVVKGSSYASLSLQERKVAERQASATKSVLTQLLPQNIPLSITTSYTAAVNSGSGIVLWALCSEHEEMNLFNPNIFGMNQLGEKKRSAEDIGTSVAKQFINIFASKCAVDNFLGDQLLVYLALVGGSMTVEYITPHMKGVCYIIKEFLGKSAIIKQNTISFY